MIADDPLHLVCGGSLTDDYGELVSSGFPSDYCNSTNCTWAASFTTTKQVTLTFNVFDTEDGDEFRVLVRDPRYGDGAVDLYSISGLCLSDRECPPGAEISFLATNVTFVFSTDHSVSAMGFNISYRISDLSKILEVCLLSNFSLFLNVFQLELVLTHPVKTGLNASRLREEGILPAAVQEEYLAQVVKVCLSLY